MTNQGVNNVLRVCFILSKGCVAGVVFHGLVEHATNHSSNKKLRVCFIVYFGGIKDTPGESPILKGLVVQDSMEQLFDSISMLYVELQKMQKATGRLHDQATNNPLSNTGKALAQEREGRFENVRGNVKLCVSRFDQPAFYVQSVFV